VDKLRKRLIIILVQDTIIAYKLAPLFLLHIVGAFAFTSFRSRDLMSCDSASPNRVAEEVYPTL
jgi:hypothetical protein